MTLLDRHPRMVGNARPGELFACLIDVMHHDARMPTGNSTVNSDPKQGCSRITVTLPAEHYQEILRVAKSKRVSASWVIRDAVEKYLAEDMPLFAASGRRVS
ncbi:MAG: ribbon-helix-helix domain-containing protein [Verrucomicrobia bacterium]|nr:ribbon-helix-helix domain-containing protein [Verrucomicrobiota bacterium]